MEQSSTFSWQDLSKFKARGENEERARERMTATILTPEEVRREEEAELRLLGVNYEIVTEQSSDWSMIEALVHESLPTHEIYSLERVINPLLTYKFQKKKAELESRGQVPNIIFGFRSSFGKDYKDKHRKVCSEGHVLSSGDYGLGIYFAKHAIYPTYLFRNYRQSPYNQYKTVTGPDADGSGSMEMIVSELLLGNTFNYGNEISLNPSNKHDSHFQDHDSIQGTEVSFGVSDPLDYQKDFAYSMGWHQTSVYRGPRFEASYYATNPFDIENGRQYVFDNPDKCNPRFIVNIRPKVSKTVVVENLDLKTMFQPSSYSPEVLMFQNKIIAEINGQRVVISYVNSFGPDYLRLEETNTIGLVDPGIPHIINEVTSPEGQGGGYRKRKTKKRTKKHTKKRTKKRTKKHTKKRTKKRKNKKRTWKIYFKR